MENIFTLRNIDHLSEWSLSFICSNCYLLFVLALTLLIPCRRTGRAGNKGTAYTFITPEQVQYAGDIIKALELSETKVPEHLHKWWDEYKKQAEAVSCLCFTSYFVSNKPKPHVQRLHF